MKTIKGDFFLGNKVSAYGIENGFVDYRTLAEAFDAVLCNDVTKLFFSAVNSEPELFNGCDYDSDSDEIVEVFQYYIIDQWGAEVLESWTDEIVYYLPELDMYVWGVTHFGTSWDYVLTDIKIVVED